MACLFCEDNDCTGICIDTEPSRVAEPLDPRLERMSGHMLRLQLDDLVEFVWENTAPASERSRG